MTEQQEHLSREIAASGADWNVERFHSHLPQPRRLRLWSRYYDTILAGIYAFHEVDGAIRIRARALASEN